MVEDVVGVKAELRLDAFGNRETLRDCQVVVKCMRATQRVESRITDLAATGKRIWTGDGACERAGIKSSVCGSQITVVGKWRNWSEPVCITTALGHAGRNLRGAA